MDDKGFWYIFERYKLRLIFVEKQQRILTNKISLKPRQSSSTTFRICGTRVKILRGRTQRSIINNCAPEFGGTLFGIQHKNTKLV